MNIHHRSFRSSLTTKSQVTVPKGVREVLGLKPGDGVSFVIDEAGKVSFVPADGEAEVERRIADIMRGVREARQAYRAEAIDLGMDPVDYVDWIRGPAAEV